MGILNGEVESNNLCLDGIPALDDTDEYFAQQMCADVHNGS